jgi:MOSC domain-containing protein YiiM
MAVHASGEHEFSKAGVSEITLVAGLGVAGDAHNGATVRHRSRVAVDASQPNLRQVHLLASELFAELVAKGYVIRPGDLGENVTTAGIDLIDLPVGSVLRLGEQALVGVTGLRNPCQQIEAFRKGLLREVAYKDAGGRLVRKAGVMAVVLLGGVVRPGDAIECSLPPGPARALERV